MQDIFNHIKSSETEKPLEVRPELWNRLDRRIGNRRRRSQPNWKRFIWMAASLLILMITVFGVSIKSDSYSVEDLNTSGYPYFTKDDISGLERTSQEDNFILSSNGKFLII